VFAASAGAPADSGRSPLRWSYAGPVDTKKYSEARKSLMQQIAQRQQQMEEQKKRRGARVPRAPRRKAPCLRK
jgi:hypothetical protein